MGGMVCSVKTLIKKRKERERIEERRDIYRHAMELAAWNSPKFQQWWEDFTKAYEANRNAALRATLRRGDLPKDREVIPWNPYNG